MIQVVAVKRWPALDKEISDLQKGAIFKLASELVVLPQEIEQFHDYSSQEEKGSSSALLQLFLF